MRSVLQRWWVALAAPRHRTLLAGIGIAALGLLVTALMWPREWPTAANGQQTIAATSVAPSARAGAAAPADSPPVSLFMWDDDQGVRHRAAVESSHYESYTQARRPLTGPEQARVLTVAVDELHRGTAPVFFDVETRIPRYADWVFDWWTSWILLGRGFAWTWESLPDGPILGLPDRVQARLVDAVQQNFDSLVLDPATSEPKLREAVDRSIVAARDELTRQCGDAETAMRDFIRREARNVERFDAVKGWLPDPGWNRDKAGFRPICAGATKIDKAAIQEDLRGSLEEMSVGGPIDGVIVRLARPFATKLISFVILPIIVTALLGGFILPLFSLLPNVISGVVIGILTGALGAAIIGFSASASVDWLLNRTDEALSRAGFEAEIRQAVSTAEIDFESKVTDAQRLAIEAQLRTITASLIGRPAK
jgi:hypothetical protein